MNILKGIATSILSFLLFLSLIIFGITLIVNQTLLNPDFIISQLDKIDTETLVEEIISEQEDGEGLSEEIETALLDTVSELEPVIKEQLYAALDGTYDYLLGKREEPELKTVLGNTFLNSEFVSSVLDKIDLPMLVEDFMPADQDVEDIPEEFTDAITDVITELEPDIKEKVVAASDPIFDYLLGETESIDLAYTLRNDVLTSDFTLSLIDNIAIFSLASEAIGSELMEDFPEEMEFLLDDIDELLPELSDRIEEEIGDNIDQLLDYLLGQRQTVNIVISLEGVVEDLEDSLRENLINMPPDTLEPLIRSLIIEQISGLVPGELEHLVEDAVTDEWVEQQTETALSPVLSYMLGESSTVNVVISLGPVIENLKESYKEEFLESPPPELSGLPPSEIEEQFDAYYQDLVQYVPSTIVIDENLLGADLPAQVDELLSELAQMIPTSFDLGEMVEEMIPQSQVTDALAEAEGQLADVRQDIDEALADAEEGLATAREYIGYFQLGFKVLIAVIVVLIIGIILLNLQVRSFTRKLGIIFTVYGALELAEFFVAKYFVERQIAKLDIPPFVQELIPQFTVDFLSVLQWFSIGCLVLGVALLVVSFVYRRSEAYSGDSAD
jgi:hypothetical protein